MRFQGELRGPPEEKRAETMAQGFADNVDLLRGLPSEFVDLDF